MWNPIVYYKHRRTLKKFQNVYDSVNKWSPLIVQNISSLQHALDIVEKIITGRKHDLSNNLLARLVPRRMDQKKSYTYVASCTCPIALLR